VNRTLSGSHEKPHPHVGGCRGGVGHSSCARWVRGQRDRPVRVGRRQPWTYLAAIAAVLIVAISAVSGVTVRLARRSPLTVLGEL
jgi:hypothetical protein